MLQASSKKMRQLNKANMSRSSVIMKYVAAVMRNRKNRRVEKDMMEEYELAH